MTNRLITLSMAALLALPAMSLAGEKRLDISPAVLINLADGHSGDFMGGAISSDLYLTRAFAIRTTLGYTKDRVYPSNRDYSEAAYRTWASLAPYVEANIGNRLRPYLALQGSITAVGTTANSPRVPTGFEQAPVSTVQAEYRNSSYFSTGITIGMKVQLSRPLALYGEISHFFYSTVDDGDVFVVPLDNGGASFGLDRDPIDTSFDLERNPTYASFGLSYSFTVGSEK